VRKRRQLARLFGLSKRRKRYTKISIIESNSKIYLLQKARKIKTNKTVNDSLHNKKKKVAAHCTSKLYTQKSILLKIPNQFY
jgi:hypothetical protein